MKIHVDPNGYTLWLSAHDTHAWATRPGDTWPCSVLAGRRLKVEVDKNRLVRLRINGVDDVVGRLVSYDELTAIVAAHLPTGARHFWPVWDTAAPEPAATLPVRTKARRVQDRYRAYAKANLHRDGELEFDDVPLVSLGAFASGAYVQAWVWVDASKLD